MTLDEHAAPVSPAGALRFRWKLTETAADRHPIPASASGRSLAPTLGTAAGAGQMITLSCKPSDHPKGATGNAAECFQGVGEEPDAGNEQWGNGWRQQSPVPDAAGSRRMALGEVTAT